MGAIGADVAEEGFDLSVEEGSVICCRVGAAAFHEAEELLSAGLVREAELGAERLERNRVAGWPGGEVAAALEVVEAAGPGGPGEADAVRREAGDGEVRGGGRPGWSGGDGEVIDANARVETAVVAVIPAEEEGLTGLPVEAGDFGGDGRAEFLGIAVAGAWWVIAIGGEDEGECAGGDRVEFRHRVHERAGEEIFGGEVRAGGTPCEGEAVFVLIGRGGALEHPDFADEREAQCRDGRAGIIDERDTEGHGGGA